MGISEPTPIQVAAMPPLLEGKDVIGQAKTGSGKTLAYALPMVERCEPGAGGVQALVLVPTRELAIQVDDVVQKLAPARKIRSILLYGGRSPTLEQHALARGADIVVGTPGRVLDHMWQGTLRVPNLKMLILDEGDEMLDKGFAPDVEKIISFTPQQRQTVIVSATLPPWVKTMVDRHSRNPVTVRVDSDTESPSQIEHVVYTVDNNRKFDALRSLLDDRENGSVLVFGRTKWGVQKLAQCLEEVGYPVGSLQGNLSQPARERVMAKFRAGRVPILVATNVAARGLDVAGVDLVVNYELPESERLFVHRVGRTGRMGREGVAVTFITPEDMPKWRRMERDLGREFVRKAWGSPRSEGRPQQMQSQNGNSQSSRPQRSGPPQRRRRRNPRTAPQPA
ncbi:MAG: DEAD/DEAH box helicase [Chloroflexi bacterium]|nr:DEAD/DEAH box helicase [Chloroflexota bacterium]